MSAHVHRSPLRLRGFGVTLGRAVVLAAIDLALPSVGMTVLLGPSGSGKSTLLGLIAGLDTPDAGDIRWAGASLNGVPTHARGFGLMFQDYALFPHKDVAANVGFGLRMQGQTRAAVAAGVTEALALVGLSGFERRDEIESVATRHAKIEHGVLRRIAIDLRQRIIHRLGFGDVKPARANRACQPTAKHRVVFHDQHERTRGHGHASTCVGSSIVTVVPCFGCETIASVPPS